MTETEEGGGGGWTRQHKDLLCSLKKENSTAGTDTSTKSKIYIKINTIAAFGFIKMITEAIHTDLFQKASLPHNLDNIAM